MVKLVDKTPIYKKYLSEIIIILIAFLFYGNTINNDYSLDDIYVVQDNEQIEKGFAGLGEIFTSFYAELNGDDGKKMQYGYRPVGKASFAIEHQIFGQNPHINHFFSILYYLIAALIMYRVFKKLMLNIDHRFILLFVLIWIAHPIHTEVVASLKNRDEIFVVIFGFLSLKFFLDYYDKGKLIYILIGMLSFALAYFSKASAMVFIAAFPLALYFFRDVSTKKLLIVSLSIIAIGIIAFYMPKLILEKQIRPVVFYENPMAGNTTIFGRFATAMTVLLFYLKMTFIPYPMSFYYGYNTFPIVGMDSWQVYVSLILYIGLFIIAILRIKNKNILSFAILFFIISISIYANLVRSVMGIAADRFLFTPTIGFSIALIYLIFILTKTKLSGPSVRIKPAVYIIITVLMIPSLFLTQNRNKDWKNQLSIIKADVNHLENSAKANYLYANTIRHEFVKNTNNAPQKKRNDVALMEKHYVRAVQIYDGYFEAWNQLGELNMLVKKDNKKAEKYFLEAIKNKPDFKTPYANLGYLYDQTSKPNQAIDYYEKAIEIDNSDIRTISNLSNVYFKQQNFKKAIEINDKIINIDPSLDLPYYNKGRFLMQSGDTVQAIQNLEKAANINPKNRRVLSQLINYYRSINDMEKAKYYNNLALRAKN